MGVPAISLNESTRNILSVVTSIVSFLCMIVHIFVLCGGAYIQVIIESKTRFLEGFDTAVLPGFIIFIGIYGMFHNLVCCVVFFKVRKEKKRKRMSKFLLGIVISGMVLTLFTLAVGLVCFALIPQLDKSYEKGILKAIKKYRTDQPTKYEMDMIQIAFECCGSNGYSDWFGVNWINHDYLVNKKGVNMDSKIGYTNDDVPFSCCSPKAKRPCIHHHIHDNHVHYNYDYKVETTLNMMGCKQALTTYYGLGVLTKAGILISSSSLAQILLLVVTRFLQTSIMEALKSDDMTNTTPGFLFPSKEDKDESDDEDKAEGKPLLEGSDDEAGKGDKNDKTDKKDKPKKVTSEQNYDDIENPSEKNNEGQQKEPIYANIKQKEEPIYANIKQDEEPIYANIDRKASK